MFSIIGFVTLFIAIFLNNSIVNLYLWPICIIIFSALFFASYDLQSTNTVISSQNTSIVSSTESYTTFQYEKDVTNHTEGPFSYMFLGLGLLSLVLFIWDLWQKGSETWK
jgi:hypothetical protein